MYQTTHWNSALTERQKRPKISEIIDTFPDWVRNERWDLEAYHLQEREKYGVSDLKKGYMIEISDICNPRQNPAKFHLHADVVKKTWKHTILPGGWDFLIRASSS